MIFSSTPTALRRGGGKLARTRSPFRADQTTRVVDAGRRAGKATQFSVKASTRDSSTGLGAPIDGTVLQRAITTLCQGVTSSQALMTLAPSEVLLEVEALPLDRHMTEFRQMTAHGIDGLRALVEQHITGAQHDRCPLCRFRLHGDKAHRRSPRRLPYGLGICRIILVPLAEGFDSGRRCHVRVASRAAALACPEMGTAAGLHGHQAPLERQGT